MNGIDCYINTHWLQLFRLPSFLAAVGILNNSPYSKGTHYAHTMDTCHKATETITLPIYYTFGCEVEVQTEWSHVPFLSLHTAQLKTLRNNRQGIVISKPTIIEYVHQIRLATSPQSGGYSQPLRITK